MLDAKIEELERVRASLRHLAHDVRKRISGTVPYSGGFRSRLSVSSGDGDARQIGSDVRLARRRACARK